MIKLTNQSIIRFVMYGAAFLIIMVFMYSYYNNSQEEIAKVIIREHIIYA